MQEGRPASGSALSGGKAAALLLLAGWCAPGVAAPGLDDTLCPQSAERSILLDIPATELSVETADHGTAGAASGSLPRTAASSAEVAAILTRIFDESLPAEIEEPAMPARSAPVADLNSTGRGQDNAEPGGSKDGDEGAADDAFPETATRFPGLSDSELRRYRRQMYRTDI